MVRFRGISVDPLALFLTLIVAAAGGILARWLHLPLGLLLGSLVAIGVMAAFDLRILGKSVHLPSQLRMVMVPVIGVSIGGAFTPEVVGQALDWGPSLLALCLYLPLAHLVGFRIYRWGGVDRITAYWGSVPGGLIESVSMGEQAGADTQMLVVMQFLRLILTIVAVPVAFLLLTGHAVGSASGAQLAAKAPLSLWDVALLLAVGASGALLGRALRLPGWQITGPILVSALAHGSGLTSAVPPQWLVGAVQVVMGAGLGVRFAGLPKGLLGRTGKLAMLATASTMTLALLFALALYQLVSEPLAAVFLAFAPGGLAEMSLIALSLQMSVVYVTAHHVARIVLSVTFARIGARFTKDQA